MAQWVMVCHQPDNMSLTAKTQNVERELNSAYHSICTRAHSQNKTWQKRFKSWDFILKDEAAPSSALGWRTRSPRGTVYVLNNHFVNEKSTMGSYAVCQNCLQTQVSLAPTLQSELAFSKKQLRSGCSLVLYWISINNSRWSPKFLCFVFWDGELLIL